MPCYRPIFNYFFSKTCGINASKARPRSSQQTPTDRGAIKMVGLSNSWHRDRDLLESEDGDRFQSSSETATRFGNVVHAHGRDGGGSQRVVGSNDIWVSREFTTTVVTPNQKWESRIGNFASNSKLKILSSVVIRLSWQSFTQIFCFRTIFRLFPRNREYCMELDFWQSYMVSFNDVCLTNVP